MFTNLIETVKTILSLLLVGSVIFVSEMLIRVFHILLVCSRVLNVIPKQYEDSVEVFLWLMFFSQVILLGLSIYAKYLRDTGPRAYPKYSTKHIKEISRRVSRRA